MINTPEWVTAGEPKWTANTCPDGWRLPTQAEFESLINSGRTWADANTRGNALDGVFFGANHATATIGNMQGCIFLPALGVRSELDGSLGSNLAYGLRGGYWSNTSNGVDHTTGLTIAPNYINVVAVDKLTWAQSVRCVQDATGAGAGTIISGLKWANTNVAQPRTFAIDSDTHTEFYQWNRDRAWAATGDVDLDEWKEATQQEWVVNPCPEGGWRVPTQGEFDALINSGYTWANANAKQNAVSGMFFGRNHAVATMSNMQGCIFLPACGSLRDPAWTSYDGVYYWSSTQNESDTIYGEHLSQGHILGYNTTYPTHKRIGRSIRCVRGVPHPSVNGVVWAETNLTADGTFASRPDRSPTFSSGAGMRICLLRVPTSPVGTLRLLPPPSGLMTPAPTAGGCPRRKSFRR